MVVLDTERLDRASTKLVMMVNSEGCPARSAAEWAGIMIPTENRLDSFAGVIAFILENLLSRNDLGAGVGADGST